MRLATMTWLRNYNYGTVLQAFALSKYLIDNEHDTFVIDYESFKPVVDIEQETSVFSVFKNKMFSKSVARKGNWNIYQENVECFEAFVNRHIPVSKRVTLRSELIELTRDLDAVICGSDQIWSPTFFDPHYFLDFVNDVNRIIAYAPSLGVSSINSQHIKNRMRDLLGRFKYLSLREKSGCRYVEEEFGMYAEAVVDPVFLLDKEKWGSIADESSLSICEPYMVTYFLGDTREHWNAVNEFSKKNNMKNIIIPVQYSHLKRIGGKYEPISPEDFLKLIRDAEYVFTDSFHATAFSVIFRKNFCCFERFMSSNSASQNTRIYDLLHTLGIDRCILPYRSSAICHTPLIEYKDVLIKLRNKINSSKLYLKNALNQITPRGVSCYIEETESDTWIELVKSKVYCMDTCADCDADNRIYLVTKKIIELLTDINVNDFYEMKKIVGGGMCNESGSGYVINYYCPAENIVIGTPCGIESAKSFYKNQNMIYIELSCIGKIMDEIRNRLNARNSSVIQSDDDIVARKMFKSGCCYAASCYECKGFNRTLADLSIVESNKGICYLFVNSSIGEMAFEKLEKNILKKNALTIEQINTVISRRMNPIRPVFYEEMRQDLISEKISLLEIYNKYLVTAERNKSKQKLVEDIERLVKKIVRRLKYE